MVVKRFFGEGNSLLKNIAKEAKMLESICHPNITQFIGVCSKPVAIMMDYECFDFSPFGLNHQISNLLKFLNTLGHIEGQTEAFEHFLPVFPKAAKDVAKGLCFLHSNDIVHRDLKPRNVLVSNRHHCKKDISADQLPSVFAEWQNAKLDSLSVKLENACKEVAEVKTELQTVRHKLDRRPQSTEKENIYREPVPKQLKVCANFFSSTVAVGFDSGMGGVLSLWDSIPFFSSFERSVQVP